MLSSVTSVSPCPRYEMALVRLGGDLDVVVLGHCQRGLFEISSTTAAALAGSTFRMALKINGQSRITTMIT